MQRPQKTAQAGCPCEGMLETKSNKGACSIALTETDRRDGAEDLLERILDRNNLNKAYLKVKKNGGSAGVDGMTVGEMLPYLKEHREELLTALRNGWYKPQAVRRVEIPKPDGGVRKLGVPTVIDRMIQQAIVQVLQPMYEPHFSDSSYGFRPKRSAHQAIGKALEYYERGSEPRDSDRYVKRANQGRESCEADTQILKERRIGTWLSQSDERGNTARRQSFSATEQHLSHGI